MITQEKPLVVGIDPGLSGALCFVHAYELEVLALYDMPTYSKPGVTKKKVNLPQLAKLLTSYADKTGMAVVEEPGAMPNQGLSSTFKFGVSCGQIQGCVAASGVDMLLAKPQVWKPSLGIGKGKDSAIQRARIEFPELDQYLTRKMDHDRAEAALLTLYAIKFLG